MYSSDCMLLPVVFASSLMVVASSSAPGVYLITGATEGLGLAAAHQVARQGHIVIVHGRSRAKVDGVVQQLTASGATAHGVVADLSSMVETRRLGEEVSAAWPSLNGLLNNAGSFDGDYSGERVVTEEGNEYTLAVNVLAPFLLTAMVLPSLRASGRGRVVISSSVSQGAGERLDDLQLEGGSDAHTAYSLSKLCDAMLSAELHERYGDPPRLTFNTMDPTQQIGMGADTKMLRAGWGAWGRPPAEATISADMLVGKEWEARSGHGFSSRREVASSAARRALWDKCVQLTGAEYP
jgi:NAD(P)-dependent dehydrogenase (short-subunit alcohol dehydrogenase family)